MNNFDNLPLVLTPKDVSEILGMKKNAVYFLFNSKTFPSEQIGGKHVIPKYRFLRWLGIQN